MFFLLQTHHKKKEKGSLRLGKDFLKAIYLINDLYLEYM